MHDPRNSHLRRTASSHLSALALVGIIATLSLTVMAIWATHERAQAANTPDTQSLPSERSPSRLAHSSPNLYP